MTSTSDPARAEPTAAPTAEPAALRVLVGFDGRSGSDDALALARALAETTAAELIVASVRPYWPDLLGPDGFARAIESDQRWIAAEAEKILGALPISARALAGGEETGGLKELAEVESIDLIVLGSTHRAGLARACPGNLGERVLDGAPCAVAVAPRGLAERNCSLDLIAVGYDGSRAADAALRRAIGLAARTGASLLVLGAVEVSLGLSGFETRAPMRLERNRMEHHLGRALSHVPESVTAESRLLLGSASEILADAAREADLLVLGSRGHYGTPSRIVLGSVGAAVVHDAPCPTLITPTA
ncbi:MAG: universal stress protein [Solirubrobacterales bacterium]